MAYTAKDIAALYIAMFDRAPEKEGLDYWLNEANSGKSLEEIANAMAAAAKQFPDTYPQYANYDPTDADSVKAVINEIYKILFNKDETKDPNGVNYWVNEITQNGKDLGTVVVTLEKAALEYLNDSDETAKAAAETFVNRVDAAVKVANTLPKADINGDGKIDSADFKVFQEIIKAVTDNPDSINEALKTAEDYAPKDFDLTSGKDNIVGTDGVNKFVASIGTLNDGDSIDGKGGIDTLQAEVNKNINDLKLKNVEKVEITSYGNHFINFSKASGVTQVASIDSTATLSLKNLTSKVGLKLSGVSQKVNADYNGLNGSNDVLNLTLSKATKANVSVSSGFEKANILLDGNNSLASINNMPSDITISGNGKLNLATNISVSNLTLKGDVSIETGKDTDNDGFVDSKSIVTETGGSLIRLGDTVSNIKVKDNSNGGDSNTILGGNKTDIIAISKVSGDFIVKTGDGDDQVLAGGNSGSYTTSDIIDLGSGEDTLVYTVGGNNSIVLKGVENITLKNTATGTNTLISDQANKITVEVGNAAATTFGIKKLADGSTVHVVNAKNQTAGFKSATISYAKAQDSATITFDAKAALTQAINITNVKNLSLVANQAVTGTKKLNLKAVNTLDLKAAKTLTLGNISDTATTDTLKNLKINGSATVTVGNVSSTAIETAAITAAKTLKVGNIANTTKAVNFKSVTLKSTTQAVKATNKVIGNTKANVTKVNVNAAKTFKVKTIKAHTLGTINITAGAKVTATKFSAQTTIDKLNVKANKTANLGTIKAKKINNITVASNSAKVTAKVTNVTKTLGTLNIKAAKTATVTIAGKNLGNITLKSTSKAVKANSINATGSLKSLSIKANTTAKITTKLSAKTLGKLNINATKGKVTIGTLTITGTKETGNININAKTNVKVTAIKNIQAGKGFSNIKITAGNNIQIDKITAKDTNGLNVTLKAGKSGKITNKAGNAKMIIKNTKGNISSVVLSGKSAKVAISVATGTGYVKSVNASGVKSGATLTIKSNDASGAITSKTNVTLGGNSGKTNNVILSGKVDGIDLSSGAANDIITLKVGSKVNASFNLGAGTDVVKVSSKTSGSTISINGGSGNDKVVLEAGSAFNTTDKIKDFKNGSDSIVIDLKASGTKVGAKSRLNDIPTKAVKTNQLKIWNTSGKLKSGTKVKTNLNSSSTAKALKSITTKALWIGSKLSKTSKGGLKLGNNKTVKVSKADTAVIFFYDTDDHKLEIAKAIATKASKVKTFSMKTVATITLHNGTNLTAGDILIF